MGSHRVGHDWSDLAGAFLVMSTFNIDPITVTQFYGENVGPGSMYHRGWWGNRAKSPSSTGENQLTRPNTETLLNGVYIMFISCLYHVISCGDIEVSTKGFSWKNWRWVFLGEQGKRAPLPLQKTTDFHDQPDGTPWLCQIYALIILRKRKQNLKRKLPKFLIP